jgi:hypothetical protein
MRSNSDPSVVQPVASRYTVYAIPALRVFNFWTKFVVNLLNVLRFIPRE